VCTVAFACDQASSIFFFLAAPTLALRKFSSLHSSSLDIQSGQCRSSADSALIKSFAFYFQLFSPSTPVPLQLLPLPRFGYATPYSIKLLNNLGQLSSFCHFLVLNVTNSYLQLAL